VEDNGIGVDPQYHEIIFEMFQRLNPSYEGTGIGLALVKKAVTRMRGTVGVESQPGKGSRFWLQLAKA
jgi:signal transduction histidine kinase